MPTFEYALCENYNDDRVYVPMDDAFDLSTFRVETGITIDGDSLTRARGE